VPLVQRNRCGVDGARGLVRVEQVGVVTRPPVEVLAQQREPQVTGELPRSVTEPAGVARLAVVARVVEHGGRQLTGGWQAGGAGGVGKHSRGSRSAG
jgi:hypothetical protein